MQPTVPTPAPNKDKLILFATWFLIDIFCADLVDLVELLEHASRPMAYLINVMAHLTVFVSGYSSEMSS